MEEAKRFLIAQNCDDVEMYIHFARDQWVNEIRPFCDEFRVFVRYQVKFKGKTIYGYSPHVVGYLSLESGESRTRSTPIQNSITMS